MQVGGIIKEIRKGKGLRQNFIAGKAGITPVFLSQIESNFREPSLKTLVAISEAIQIPVEVILLKSLQKNKSIASAQYKVIDLALKAFN